MKRTGIAILITLLGLFALACPERKSIGEIEAHPDRYQGKEVAIAGTVKDSYGLSIPGTRYGGGAYKIDDGTGSIWVLVTDGNVPSKGTQIGVKGRVETGINWNGRNYGLGIHEEDRRYKTK